MNIFNTLTYNKKFSICLFIMTIVLIFITFFGFIPVITLALAKVPTVIKAFLPLALVATLFS